jgi:hypothetical protein
MRIFEKEKTPPLIKLTIKVPDNRISKENIDIIDGTFSTVCYLVNGIKDEVCQGKNNGIKATVQIMDYSDSKIHKTKNIQIFGYDPLTIRYLIEGKIKEYGDI